MRYIRLYNKKPKPVKWTYRNANHRIGTESVVMGHELGTWFKKKPSDIRGRERFAFAQTHTGSGTEIGSLGSGSWHHQWKVSTLRLDSGAEPFTA
jgi:hypothetical protein